MVVIRLSRSGAKKRPFYHFAVSDKRNKRDGRYIERIGHFNPIAKGGEVRLLLDLERARHWISKGAQPSERVTALMQEYEKLGPEAAAKPKAHKPRVAKPQPKVEAPAEEAKAEAPAEVKAEAPAEEKAAKPEVKAEAPAEEKAAEPEAKAEAPAEEKVAEPEAKAEAPAEESAEKPAEPETKQKEEKKDETE